jgi:hypothetical protein
MFYRDSESSSLDGYDVIDRSPDPDDEEPSCFRAVRTVPTKMPRFSNLWMARAWCGSATSARARS